MQAAFQRYTDNAISKTINFDNSATIQDVRDAYWMAYEMGCRGITIYRDGSREKQILETKKEKSYYDKLAGATTPGVTPVAPSEIPAGGAEVKIPVALRPRPHVLTGKTYKVQTPVGRAYVSINEDEHGNIFELFINIGHAGTDIMADAEAIGRLISLTFRIPPLYSPDRIAQNVVDELTGIGGASSAGFGAARVRSLADAVARALREHEVVKQLQNRPTTPGTTINGHVNGNGKIATNGSAALSTAAAPAYQMAPTAQMSLDASIAPAAAVSTTAKAPGDFCPDCGLATLRFVEGCQKCENCGFSKC